MQLVSALQEACGARSEPDPPDDLVFIDGQTPGITRIRKKDRFIYRHSGAKAAISDDDRARIDSLGIPPAWEDVWICPAPNGYLQATGTDAAKRKQYRYHPAWRSYRERTKFSTLLGFGAKLPRIRRRIRRAFRERDQADCELVTAALVRLLDDAPLRIGSTGGSDSALGASTLKRGNVRVANNTLHLDYTAKGGKRVRRQVKDSRLLTILEDIDDLPGKTLFRYVGDDGEIYRLRSEQVNSWLQDVTENEQISAKTFRTWAGSLAAFEHALSDEALTIKGMSEKAARTLRNTPAIARSSYIHPAIVDLKDTPFDERESLISGIDKSARGLTRTETAMLCFLAEKEGIKVA
ncbi:DNA topoisomerase IB [Erythrobacter sp. SCSIO 43205]|uniref:DNA topoisomerase IB n=1 Tax=Erythrobacter sp. SCSIO 43205 TaxID=2779361 RepID=UPI001CA867E8|nr:DNA topoisomerase IB [Erythrobacter sp. SCSIO 43205]UAB78396.1 DNA topoisomerase IB [Erythrobacter sp. SCSIO 43205]